MWMLIRATGGAFLTSSPASFDSMVVISHKETLDNPFGHRRDWGATMPALVYNLFITDGTLTERGNIGVPANGTVEYLSRDHFTLKETAHCLATSWKSGEL